ncbi:MAG TPA: trypsin-like peptidase domain-containing protein [Gemmatimonadales bacterium]|jgi:serine protease Do|nr:trypsin-like peptidase domain-containing protein [Gemmatimonadales bacterium]
MSARSLNWLKFGGLVALAFALGLLFAGLLDLPNRSSAQDQARASAIPTVQAPSIPEAKPLVDLSDALAAVADRVRPSVVYIRSQRTERTTQRRLPPGMERFFPRFGPNRPDFEQGSGSGFIVSADGYILTNNHVVEGAETVIVRLLDRREFRAKVVGTDGNTDVAVVKIDAKSLPPVALGNSDQARVGSWVLAIGNPLGEGLTFTVTSGIVSAKGRALTGLPGRGVGSIQDFIQTDAAINPGNSGGPLVNVRGEVVGVNSAIASETGFYSGYGFAIPINLARTVMNQLITEGRVHRAALGVSIQDVSINDAQYVGLPEIRGVVVKDIPNDDSPARKAGMEPGDIIVAIDGKPVEYVGQLQQEVGFRKPGESVKVEVARKGGVRKTLNVKLQPLQETTQLAAGEAPDTGSEAAESGGLVRRRLGVMVQPVTGTIAQELQLPADARGLIVTDVTPGGPAWNILFDEETGGPDVIVSVEGKPVKAEADLRNALRTEPPGSVVSLRVYNPRQQGRRVERVRLAE